MTNFEIPTLYLTRIGNKGSLPEIPTDQTSIRVWAIPQSGQTKDGQIVQSTVFSKMYPYLYDEEGRWFYLDVTVNPPRKIATTSPKFWSYEPESSSNVTNATTELK